MTHHEAKKRLDGITGPVDPNRPPPLPQLLAWAERLCQIIPPADLDNISYQVSALVPQGRANSGFHIRFPFLEGAPPTMQSNRVTLLLQRERDLDNDPIRDHECFLELRDFPSIEAFFAAVKANPEYKFACAYAFDEVSIYADPPILSGEGG